MYKIEKDILQSGNVFEDSQIFSNSLNTGCLKYTIGLVEMFYSIGMFNFSNGNNCLQKDFTLLIKF